MDSEDLVRIAEQRGVEAFDLDEVVHETAVVKASEVNNGGLRDQILFLLDSGMLPSEIIELFEEVKS